MIYYNFKKYYEKNYIVKVAIELESKICNKCGEQKELSKFPKFSQRDGVTTGWRNTCNACMYKRRKKTDTMDTPKYLKEKPVLIPEYEEYEEYEDFELETQKRVDFTEDEIIRLKAFIDGFDKFTKRKEEDVKRAGKDKITFKLDVNIIEILRQRSKDSGINISDIINAILIKEFI